MMTSDDPNSDPGEKMTEVTQNELIDSNQMLFFRVFLSLLVLSWDVW